MYTEVVAYTALRLSYAHIDLPAHWLPQVANPRVAAMARYTNMVHTYVDVHGS